MSHVLALCADGQPLQTGSTPAGQRSGWQDLSMLGCDGHPSACTVLFQIRNRVIDRETYITLRSKTNGDRQVMPPPGLMRFF